MENIEIKNIEDGITLAEAANVKGGYYRYELQNVRISSYSVSGATAD